MSPDTPNDNTVRVPRTEWEELRELVRQQSAKIAELQDELEKARRKSKRQAAPFGRDKKKRRKKKKPGRKKGHEGSHRAVPDVVHEVREVPLVSCPECGEGVDQQSVRRVRQYIEDIVPAIRVTELTTFECDCAHCGKPIRSTDPLQVSTATGAAAAQLGPRALGLAVFVNKTLGVSLRKTCALLDKFGLKLTPGGLSHALARVASRISTSYDTLVKGLRHDDVVYADETSWWVGERGWWLWVFSNRQRTVYQVRKSRGSDVVADVLGDDFEGVLSSDCYQAYDAIACRKNKCYAHHLRAVSDALVKNPTSEFLMEVQLLLRTALAVGTLDGDKARQVARLKAWARRLLLPERRDETEQKVRNRLEKQRLHLFTFLEYDGVDPTNNQAERDLRPAVIARKISCGNRTTAGARTFEILASTAATLEKQGRSVVDEIATAMRLQTMQPVLHFR